MIIIIIRIIRACTTLVSRGTWWPGGQCLGLQIQRSGVRAPRGSNRVVSLSKAHLLPKSTGNTQEVVALSQHD